MKKFSKLFLSCAAVAAVTAAVATSAMAAGEISADQKTLLIVPSSVSLDKVTADDVVQIDQNAEIVDVALPADLKDGKYTVYMGGDGQVYSTNFKVGNASSVLVGDATQDDSIDLDDATAVVKHYMEMNTLTGDALIAADANGDESVDLDDATCIVKYYMELDGAGNVGQEK